jgi:hypothetical protein
VSLVAEHAAARLRTRAEAAIARAGLAARPDELLITVAQAYRRFAAGHAGLYAALVTDTTNSSWADQRGSARKALWDMLLRVVAGLTGNADDTGAAVAVWSFLHGFAHLGEAGMFGASGPRDGFERGLAALIAGLLPQPAPGARAARH